MTTDWTDLRCLIAVAEAGSLTRAARTLNISIATMTRRLNSLEGALNLKLVVRSVVGASLTPDGVRVHAFAASGAAEFDQIERIAAALRGGHWTDPIRVSATEPMITDVLAPALPILWQRQPGLVIHMNVSNDIASLDRREADIAVRLARPAGNSLVARRLPNIEFGCFAAASYVGQRDPKKIKLRDERVLAFDDGYGDISELAWIAAAKLDARVCMRTGSTNAQIHAVQSGAGIAMLPVAFPRRWGLVPIAGPKIRARACWMVFHRDLSRIAAVREVRDWIAVACSKIFDG